MFITDKYLELINKFPPRPIHSNEELEAIQELVDSLLDKPQMTPEEYEYLIVLGALISDYERIQEPILDIYGVELLKALLSERDLRQKDLVSIFKTESIVSDILRGKRELTARHIQELANFFNLSPAVFFPNPQ